MSALIGAGWTFDRVVKGMQQIYHGATGNDKALGRPEDQRRRGAAPVRAAGAEAPDRDRHR
jgi:hypothetical protein